MRKHGNSGSRSGALPPGKQYRGLSGKRARAREIRHGYNRVLKIVDRDSTAAIALVALKKATANEPDPEEGAQHLAFAALLASEGTGVSFADAAFDLLRRFERNAMDGGSAK